LYTIWLESVDKIYCMLDLNELSRKLDLALVEETDESLIAWMEKQRGYSLKTFIGYGDYIEMDSFTYTGYLGNLDSGVSIFPDNTYDKSDFSENNRPEYLKYSTAA
jgi:hypothetical protein